MEVLSHRQKVLQDSLSVGGKDGFGMELDPFNWMALMANPHDFLLVGQCGNLQAFGEGFALHDLAVITACLEGNVHTREQALAT